MWKAVHIKTGNEDKQLLTDQQKISRESHYATRGKYRFEEVETQPIQETTAPEPVEAKKAKKPRRRVKRA